LPGDNDVSEFPSVRGRHVAKIGRKGKRGTKNNFLNEKMVRGEEDVLTSLDCRKEWASKNRVREKERRKEEMDCRAAGRFKKHRGRRPLQKTGGEKYRTL